MKSTLLVSHRPYDLFAILASLCVVLGLAEGVALAQSMARTTDGKPDFSGIWQVMNSANEAIEFHPATKEIGASRGVVEGDEIPYRPEALKKRDQNFQNRLVDDPESKCFLPGVPRALYLPYPFQIVQTSKQITMLFEYEHVIRDIFLNSPHPPGQIEWSMGDSRGHWEGDTLVVDVVDFNDLTWFDRAGDYHTNALHLIERFTPLDNAHISYEVTIEDPKVFTRPWKMAMVLYRRIEPNLELLERECYVWEAEERKP